MSEPAPEIPITAPAPLRSVPDPAEFHRRVEEVRVMQELRDPNEELLDACWSLRHSIAVILERRAS